MGSIVYWVIVIASIVAILFALDRLFLWMEAKGWMYWRKTKHSPRGTLGNACQAVQEILEPEKGRAAEERLHEDPEKPGSGEPLVAGKSDDQTGKHSN
jgi:hypothetical protein